MKMHILLHLKEDFLQEKKSNENSKPGRKEGHEGVTRESKEPNEIVDVKKETAIIVILH